MLNENVTLKQMADELNISKSYIDKIIRTLGMHTELKKDGNKYVLNLNQQQELREFILSKKTHTDSHTETDTSMHTGVDDEIIFLRKMLAERSAEISNLHKLLDQQQQLTLQGNKQIDKLQLLLDSDSEASEQLKEQVEDSKIMLDVQSRMITQLEEIIEEKTERNKLILHELAELRKKNRTSFWRRLFPSKYNNSIRFSDYKIDK